MKFARLSVCIGCILSVWASLAYAKEGANQKDRLQQPTMDYFLTRYAAHMNSSPVLRDHIMTFANAVLSHKNSSYAATKSASSNLRQQARKYGYGDTNTGWSIAVNMNSASDTCSYAGPTAFQLVGTGLGVCQFDTQVGPVNYIYKSFACAVDDTTNTAATVSSFWDDDTCEGPTTSTSTGPSYPVCTTGSSVQASSFVTCTSNILAYEDYAGYTCIYWDDTGLCDPTVNGESFTTTVNGQCVNETYKDYNSYSTTFSASANTQTITYYSGTSCSGSVVSTSVVPLPSSACDGSEYQSFSSQCFVVG